LLDLVLNRMLNASSLFKFTMPSQTYVDFLEVAFLFVDRIMNSRKRFKSSILLIESKHYFVIFPLSSKLNSNRASYIIIPKKALLAVIAY